MRRAACVAAAVVLGGAQALVFRTAAPAQSAAGGGSCREQRGSICGSVESCARGHVGSLSRGGTRRDGAVLSMGTAAAAGDKAEAKAPWLDGTMPRELPDEISAENPLRVVIAGGGVGGLLAAKYLKMHGHDVSAGKLVSVCTRSCA